MSFAGSQSLLQRARAAPGMPQPAAPCGFLGAGMLWARRCRTCSSSGPAAGVPGGCCLRQAGACLRACCSMLLRCSWARPLFPGCQSCMSNLDVAAACCCDPCLPPSPPGTSGWRPTSACCPTVRASSCLTQMPGSTSRRWELRGAAGPCSHSLLPRCLPARPW